MSLFSSLQLANNSLRAQQIGLQVTGQNIANANTPGYIREEVVFNPAPTQRQGGLLLGLGVEVTAVIQKIDLFLEERLRGAQSERAGNEVQEQAYLQLESVVGELSETDLSTALNSFFSSIHEILNQPDDKSIRNLAVLEGQKLAGQFDRLQDRVLKIRNDADEQIGLHATDINRLVSDIAKLNRKITATEGGGTSPSDAVGLRDQRHSALEKLSELIDIRAIEQPDGTASVFVGGDYLVFQGEFRQVQAKQESVEGLITTSIQLVDTNSPLDVTGGKVAGLIAARDEISGGYLDRLDSFASTMIFEFNKVFSSAQGLIGNDTLTSEFAVSDTEAALDEAGLAFTPINGSFQIQTLNTQTGLTKTSDITVDLNGLDEDTSLEDLAAAIDAIDGLRATIDTDNKLTIAAESEDTEFAFANDTSGVLAALGLGTFFTGSTAGDIGISQTIVDDPKKFAASEDGIGVDTGAAIKLARFLDEPLESAGNVTLSNLYDRLTSQTTQASSVARGVAEGSRVFEETLRGQKLGISGVSLDEEAIKMITYQRAYQASAKYIKAISDLLDLLVNL